MKKVFSLTGLTIITLAFVCLGKAAYKLGENGAVEVEKAQPKPKKAKTSMTPFPTSHVAKQNPETPLLHELSKKFSAPVERLTYYRSLHFGYQDLTSALFISHESQVELGRVLKLRMEDKPWKDISEQFFVDPKKMEQDVQATLAPFRKTIPQEAMTERPKMHEMILP